MRIDKDEDLLKLKIDIQIDIDVYFQEVAILVDRPDFLCLLPKLRNDFGIEKTVGLDEFIQESYDKPFSNKDKIKKKIDFSKYKDPEYLKDFAKNNETNAAWVDINQDMDLYQFIATEVNLTCLQFQRPPYFANMVRQAIYCGKVDSAFFCPTYPEVIEKDSLTSTSGIFQLPQVALMISPTSTYEDVKSALRDAQLLYKTDKRLYYYKPRVDTVGNIRKYRYFYWKRVEGLKLDKIASDWVESQLPRLHDFHRSLQRT